MNRLILYLRDQNQSIVLHALFLIILVRFTILYVMVSGYSTIYENLQ